MCARADACLQHACELCHSKDRGSWQGRTLGQPAIQERSFAFFLRKELYAGEGAYSYSWCQPAKQPWIRAVNTRKINKSQVNSKTKSGRSCDPRGPLQCSAANKAAIFSHTALVKEATSACTAIFARMKAVHTKMQGLSNNADKSRQIRRTTQGRIAGPW